MEDPVVAADGMTYERHAITRWLDAGNTVSPVTNAVLDHTMLSTNQYLRSCIREWQAKQVAKLERG